MKASEITIEILHNLGNYENVKLSCTYNVVDMADERIDEAFAMAKRQLDQTFAKLYAPATTAEKSETKPATTAEKSETKPATTAEKSETKPAAAKEYKVLNIDFNKDSLFSKVLVALKQGRVQLHDLRKYYAVSNECMLLLEQYSKQ